VLAALHDADAMGTAAAVVFGSKQARGDGAAFEADLRDFARESRMAVCGPNSNGFFNVTDLIACTSAPFAALPDPPRGDVAIVSHSGALVSSLVTRLARNGLGLSYTCAIGNSVDVGVADFLHLVAADENARTVLVYAEGLTDREAFFSGTDAAIAAGKRVVVFRAGCSLEGNAAVQAHTGVLAGASEAFRAACEHCGIIVADDLEEFVTLPVVLRGRRTPGPGGYRVGIAAGSGAISAMLTDVARGHGFAVPPLDATTTGAVDPGAGISMANPLNLAVHDAELSQLAVTSLAADPNIDLVVFGIQSGPTVITDPVHQALASVAQAGKDVLVWSAGGTTAIEEPILTAAGVPVVPSAETLFRCIRKTLDRIAPSASASRRSRPAAIARTKTALRLIEQIGPGIVPGNVAWQLLALYGVPALAEHPVTLDDASAAAEWLGYPVVAKLTGRHLPHKSDLGLVFLNLETVDAVQDAVRRLTATRERIGDGTAHVVLQKPATPGCELILAARADRDAGPHVVVGFGGVFAEILSDIVIALAPATQPQAQSLISGLRGASLLSGARGTTTKDLPALCAAVCAISELAADLCGPLEHLEVNPLIVTETGVVAIDVLASAATR